MTTRLAFRKETQVTAAILEAMRLGALRYCRRALQRRLPRVVVILVAALMMLPSGSAWADQPDASDVEGSFRIDYPDHTTAPKCLPLAELEVITISQVGSNDLELTLPSGPSFHLTPTAPTEAHDDASWTGSDDEESRYQVRQFNFNRGGELEPRDTIDFTLQDRQDSTCSGWYFGYRVDSPTTLVKDPKTGSWVIWLLVPGAAGLGWVIYKVAKTARKSSRDNQRKEYLLDVGTQDGRLSLNADGEDELWVYAQVRCNRPEVDTAAITSALTFTTEGVDARWLLLGPPVMANGFKTLPVRAWPPWPDAEPQEGEVPVVVWTTLEGRPLTGRVPLTLEVCALRIY